MADVTIQNLTKEYGSLIATNDISLDIEDGELVVFVGPSGCGKTTTLRSVAGLTPPTSGTIAFDSTDVTDKPPQERNISMVFQDLALYPHMTAFENVAFPLRATNNRSESEIEEAVDEIAELTDCAEFLDKRVMDLSGGQQQRVALARALVRKPEVFLMDEPFSDLDELLKRRLRSEVVRLQHELGITMIHVTHDQEEAMTMGDRLVVMNDGDIAQMGDPDTVFNEPQNLFVAMFIGSPQINRFDCTLSWEGDAAVLTAEETTFTLDGDAAEPLRNASSDRISLCVRPQHLQWSDGHPGEDVDAFVHVTVQVVEKIGTEDTLRCLTEDGHEVVAVVPSGTISEDQTGYLSMAAADIHLFDGHDQNAERLN
jgi:multiple sugar transport system ATP-binding protein